MAIRINRVYTRGGDAGETSLVGGQRIAKGAICIESYGTVDEPLVGERLSARAGPSLKATL
ncbi:MAG: hypothetical protein ACXWFO_01115 [Candidatus Aminicenantales bacterium]